MLRPRRGLLLGRLTRAAVVVVASAVVPTVAHAGPSGRGGPDLTRWFNDTATHALRAAEPTNDPVVLGLEGFNRGVAGAFRQVQQFGPAWLDRFDLELGLDRELRPRYAVGAAQPVLQVAGGRNTLMLHGRFLHEATATGGDLGLRYRGRLDGQPFTVGLEGGFRDRHLARTQQYRVGAEFRLAPVEVSANAFDAVPEYPVAPAVAERRLDSYDLEVRAPVPGVRWAWLKANRLWQIAADGDQATTSDRVSLRVLPLSPLEVVTGTQARGEDRSWFAQLRVRIKLGDG